MQLPPQCRKDAAGLFSKISKSGVRFFFRKDKALEEKRMGQIWSKGRMTPQKKMLTSGKRLSLTLTECRRNFFRRMAEKIFFFGKWH